MYKRQEQETSGRSSTPRSLENQNTLLLWAIIRGHTASSMGKAAYVMGGGTAPEKEKAAERSSLHRILFVALPTRVPRAGRKRRTRVSCIALPAPLARSRPEARDTALRTGGPRAHYELLLATPLRGAGRKERNNAEGQDDRAQARASEPARKRTRPRESVNQSGTSGRLCGAESEAPN